MTRSSSAWVIRYFDGLYHRREMDATGAMSRIGYEARALHEAWKYPTKDAALADLKEMSAGEAEVITLDAAAAMERGEGGRHMDIDAYQAGAKRTAKYPKEAALTYTTLGLAGEAGEVANKVKKLIRDFNGQAPTIGQASAIADELGDTLWYVAMAADALGYSLSAIAAKNLEKLSDRAARGTIGGEGDVR